MGIARASTARCQVFIYLFIYLFIYSFFYLFDFFNNVLPHNSYNCTVIVPTKVAIDFTECFLKSTEVAIRINQKFYQNTLSF